MLQPCGWLSVFMTAPLAILSDDMLYRNLDGAATFHAEVVPTSGTLRTRVRLLSASVLARTCLVSFAIESFVDAIPVATVRAEFGFFPREAFLDQVGLPPTPGERARVVAASPFLVDLTSRPARYCAGTPRLAGPMLRMIDRVTAFDPAGGAAGLGYVRGEKDVVPGEWFFKAHFYQDPVQPGSLGLESLAQLLQFFLIERGLGEDVANARFETLQLERPVRWKYRGQVVPESRRVVTEIVVTEVGRTARGPYAVADGWLWVDGLRVYSVTNLGVAIVGQG
jgi:3-hydroxymyristoyl/3-hydroxydecanoyl-(acyl carrier protein) dehydratase